MIATGTGETATCFDVGHAGGSASILTNFMT